MTVPEGTTVTEVCKVLASNRSDAALLTGANGGMTGIVTAIDFIRYGRIVASRPVVPCMLQGLPMMPVLWATYFVPHFDMLGFFVLNSCCSSLECAVGVSASSLR